MTCFQWLLLGIMIAWTPGFLALAMILWRASELPHDERYRERNGNHE